MKDPPSITQMLNCERSLLFDLVKQTKVHLRAAFDGPCGIKMGIFPNVFDQRSDACRSDNRYLYKNQQVSQQGGERKSFISCNNLQINFNQEAPIPISGISIAFLLSFQDCILNDTNSFLNISP